MSSKISGLRRVGIVGLSTLVAASMMTGLATTASATGTALLNDFALVSAAPNVTQGASSQTAASLKFDFMNDFITNAAQTFTIAGNVCTTAPGIAAAVGFTSVPTGALTGPFIAGGSTAGTATTPTFTTVLSSSTPACLTAGIKDVVTLTLTTPSSVAGPTNWFRYTLSNIKYNVGSGATGAVVVGAAGSFTHSTPATLTNANITVGSHTVIPVIAALPSSFGNTLGTASMIETTAGTFFPAGTTAVTLTLSAGAAFTAGVTPTITVPAGYSKTSPVTVAGGTYTFNVLAPAVPIKATVSVAGLKIGVPAGPTVVTLTTSVLAGPMDAANVLNFAARTGGATRYETAAALFTNQFGGMEGVNDVVLSSGALFPDALSANYLAGRLGTGILLTTPTTLSPAARTAIINNDIATVYITGETGAVSQGVENQITAMHVGNTPAAAFINVVRIGGADRYVTNQLINENDFQASDTVLLAAGANFPDALALGPVAYNEGFPLVLTRGLTLGAIELAQLSDFNPTNVVIAGGTGVVSAAIATDLAARGYHVLRLAGVDRTLTAAAVAGWATDGVEGFTAGTIEEPQGFDSATTYISTGANFADALAAGPVAGNNNRMIVLSLSPTLLGAGIPAYLSTKAVGGAPDEVSVLHALGLTGAVSSAVMKSAAASIGQ